MTQEEYKREVRRLRPKLLQVARRYLSDDDAEDTVQDVLLRLWQMVGELRMPPDALATVLTRNLCISQLRRQQPAGLRVSRDVPDANEAEDDAAIESNKRMERILTAVNALPPMQQTILRLRHMEGMEMQQIAAITGASEAAVRKALSRARQKIRQQYMKQYGQ